MLRLLTEGQGQGAPVPRLGWRLVDAWRPVLRGATSLEAVIDSVVNDARAWEHAPVLAFRYLKVEKRGPKIFGGLTPPLAVLRAWLLRMSQCGDRPARASLAYASALMCETASSPLKKPPTQLQLAEQGIHADPAVPLDQSAMPTYFDFTSRNAQFFDQITAIRAYLDRDRVAAALSTGRPDADVPRTMDWDPGADTPAAIYTGHSRGYHPVAEWLAFRGLVFFPVTGSGERLETTACSGRRKSGTITWPLWDRPMQQDTIRSLIAYPQLTDLDAAERGALGIVALHQAGLVKKADGYSGMFSPSRPI